MKKHVRFRHHLTFAFLRFIFRWYLFFRYNFKRRYFHLDSPGPQLLLFNHAANIDGYVVGCSFRRPVYFVSTEHLFSVKGLSWLVDYLIAPITIQKNRPDLSAVRKIIKVAKEGGLIALSPEGNTTFTGESPRFDLNLVKLVKKLKIPLVFFHIKGNYLSNPRWGKSIRKNRITCEITCTLNPQEIADKSETELYELIRKSHYVNAYQDQLTNPLVYRSKAPALYLERVLIVCPKCRAFDRLYSEGAHIRCRNCDLDMSLDEYAFFNDNPYNFQTVIDWDNWQKPVIKSILSLYPVDRPLFSPAVVKVLEHVKTNKPYSHKKRLGKATFTMTMSAFTLTFQDRTVILPFDSIEEVAIADKNQFFLYFPQANTLMLFGTGRFGPYKYLIAYQIAMGKKRNQEPLYLGI
ncbi:MAG: lysophospholipid acyltransferase family protein [Candidatus Izemoplasmatales bacterium]|jgi:1-acyl-sn-glycerol-3-phosphate acyltransferase